MAIGYIGRASQEYKDKGKKSGSFSINVSTTAVGAYTAAPGTAGSIRNLFDAVKAMTLLQLQSETASYVGIDDAKDTIPTDDNAYRSAKLAIEWAAAGKTHQTTIPGRNPASYNTLLGTDILLLTTATGGTAQTEALVTAFNNAVRDELGNSGTIKEITIFGTNR